MTRDDFVRTVEVKTSRGSYPVEIGNGLLRDGSRLARLAAHTLGEQ